MNLQSKIQRYIKLLERAQSDYDTATEMLASAQQQVSALAHQVAELQQYADQLSTPEGVALAQQMLQRRQYLAQVFRAIEQLNGQQEAAEQALVRAQHRWREARAQMKAMEQLVKKYQQAQLEQDAQAEQRSLDERAAWQYQTRQ